MVVCRHRVWEIQEGRRFKSWLVHSWDFSVTASGLRPPTCCPEDHLPTQTLDNLSKEKLKDELRGQYEPMQMQCKILACTTTGWTDHQDPPVRKTNGAIGCDVKENKKMQVAMSSTVKYS